MMRKISSELLLILALLYIAPIAIYILRFGVHITSDHAKWAEFGSAMAGIYAPIVAASTLLVLLLQVKLQAQINEHQYDEAYLSQARADIEFYAERLSTALERSLLPGQSVRQALHTNFLHGSSKMLSAPSQRELAANIHSNAPLALDLCFAIYPVIAGLAAVKRGGFPLALNSSRQKLIAMLSFETCVALDNFHKTRTGGWKVPYQFSSVANTTSGA